MFSDPQTLTISSVAHPMSRVGLDLNAGTFREGNGEHMMTMSHTYGKRIRRQHRVDYKIMAPDVMDSSLNVPYSAAFYLVADVPEVGIAQSALEAQLTAYLTWHTETSFAKTLRWLAGEV